MTMFVPARVRTPAVLTLVIALLAISSSAWAGPMPPQLPTAAEMAKLQQDLSSVLGGLRAAQSEMDRVMGEFERANDRLAQTLAAILAAQARRDALDAELRAAQAAVDDRASSVYKAERIGLVNVLLEAKSFREFVTALDLLRSVTKSDSDHILRIRDLRAEQARVRGELEEQKAAEQTAIAELAIQRRAVESSLEALGREYRKVQTEIEKRKSGFAFPVKAPYSYSDTWGAPRMVGTEYYHRHEGTDIFSLRGTPVVAVVDGVVEKMGTATLGGIKLWLRSEGDGWTYFYAHLVGYARGIQNGLRVKKGTILGYVGNTGNARTTPPHLHFETHVPSGAPTNPYPILRRADPLAR